MDSDQAHSSLYIPFILFITFVQILFINMLILSLLLFRAQATIECSKQPREKMTIVAQINEEQNYLLNNLFNIKSYKEILIESQKDKFTIINPLEAKTQNRFVYLEPNKISVKFARDQMTYYSLNRYALLVQAQNGYNIYITPVNQGVNGKIKEFTQYLSLPADLLDLKCFDLDFLDQSTLLLDCAKPEKLGTELENVFVQYTFSPEKWTVLASQNPGGYQKQNQRNFKMANKLGFRGYLAAGLQQGESSYIEVYSFAAEATLQTKLSQADVRQLLQDQDFILSIIDFKISLTGELAFLNSNGLILHLKYDQNEGLWSIIKKKTLEAPFVSFDYGFINQEVVFANEQSVSVSGAVYKFPSIQTNPRVYLMKTFILVASDSSLFLYDKYTGVLDELLNEANSLVSSDIMEDDVVVFQKQTYTRYVAHKESYLRFKGSQLASMNTAKITQSNPPSKCTIDVEFQIINEGTTEIYKIKDEKSFLPYPLDKPSGTLQVDPIFVGPMIKYDCESSSKLNLTFHTQEVNEIENISTNGSRKIVYNAFYFDYFVFYLTQDEDFLVRIYYINEKNEVKELDQSFKLNLQLTRDNSQFTHFNKYIVYALEDPQHIGFYSQESKFSKEFLANSFTQIILTYEGLIAFDSASGSLVFLNNTSLQPLWTLTKPDILDRGMTSWTPSRVIGYHQSNLVAAVNSQFFAILKVTAQGFTLLYYDLYSIPECEEADAAIFRDKIALVLRLKNKGFIMQSYTTKDETDIRLERRIQYNHFYYNVSMQISFSYNEYLVHVVANTLKMKPVLITYHLYQVSHSVPYSYQTYDSIAIVAADYQHAIVVDKESKQYMAEVYFQLQGHYINNEMSLDYTKNQTLLVTLSNQQADQQIQTIQTLYIVNRYSDIYLQPNLISRDFKNLNSRSQDTCYDQSGWIKGEVTNLKIDCKQCGAYENKAAISVRNPLLMEKRLPYYLGVDIINLDDNHVAILYATKIRILSNKDFSETQIDFNDNELCYYMHVIEKGFLLSCSTSPNNFIYRYTCDQGQCKRQESALKTDALYDQFVNLFDDVLIAGNLKTIAIFYLAGGIDQLNSGVLKRNIYHSLISYGVISLDENAYNIFGITNKQNFAFWNVVVVKGDVGTVQFTEFPLNEVVNNAGYYALPSTQFLSLHPMKSYGYPQFLFTTKDLAHFIIKFKFSCQDSVCTIKSQDVLGALSPYGNWRLSDSKPFVKVFDNYVAIQYESPQTFQNIVAVYDIGNQEQDRSIPYTFIGAITETTQQKQNQFLFYKSEEKYYFMVTIGEDSMFSQFLLTGQSYAICLKGEIQDQFINVTAQNDFSSSHMLIDIGELSESSSRWWLWVILALVVVGLLAGIGYYLHQKRNARAQDTLLYQ